MLATFKEGMTKCGVRFSRGIKIDNNISLMKLDQNVSECNVYDALLSFV